MLPEERNILIVLTVLISLIVTFLIILFVVFQKRKNKMLIEKEETQKRFEKEIAETQIEIREETLRNISWELHDNIGQLLTLAKIQLQHVSLDNIHEVSETISKALQETRSLSKLINPEFINNIAFEEALRLELERFNRLKYIETRLKIEGEIKVINQKHSIVLFRMLQEFFSNTIKHSKATKLIVALKYSKKKLSIVAKDNGVGFNMRKVLKKGIGIKNIKTRAHLINAKVKLKTEIDKGVILIINYYL